MAKMSWFNRFGARVHLDTRCFPGFSAETWGFFTRPPLVLAALLLGAFPALASPPAPIPGARVIWHRAGLAAVALADS
ncbi:MAG TPA: hypothetical protein VFU59_12945, partial [Candidatus Eisenbacteria bacterium]|nr:hypothetical protein [Candidatus Eisenbacteria bacterium]